MQRSIGEIIKKGKNMTSDDFKEFLLEKLKDIDYAAGYLGECLKEGEDTFLIGLRDVVEAHGGIGKLSQNTNLNREGLYRMLSESGNPTLSSLSRVLDNLGIEVMFTRKLEGSEAA